MKKAIQYSWEQNASHWIDAIENEQIASRRYTNDSIFNMVVSVKPKLILDVGCGEGWLCRRFTKLGIEAIGIESIKQLYDYAVNSGNEEYYLADYFNIHQINDLKSRNIDCAVFNFSLFHRKKVINVLKRTRRLIHKDGHLFIQTLHPQNGLDNFEFGSGKYFNDAWKGLNNKFINGHPFYLRSLKEWQDVARESHMSIQEIREIANPSGDKLSIIIHFQ